MRSTWSARCAPAIAPASSPAPWRSSTTRRSSPSTGSPWPAPKTACASLAGRPDEVCTEETRRHRGSMKRGLRAVLVVGAFLLGVPVAGGWAAQAKERRELHYGFYFL